MKLRKGKVEAPKADPYDWKRLFRTNVVKEFAGTDGTMSDLKSEEGKAKIEAARAKTTETLGYSYEEAEKQDELEDLFNELQWAKPEPAREGGAIGVSAETEPYDVMD